MASLKKKKGKNYLFCLLQKSRVHQQATSKDAKVTLYGCESCRQRQYTIRNFQFINQMSKTTVPERRRYANYGAREVSNRSCYYDHVVVRVLNFAFYPSDLKLLLQAGIFAKSKKQQQQQPNATDQN
ncbi:conserved hypothetical protein [Trichinella spiralis]|uniref:hypothetical protein n=1 Tax=Trichinella spiralis TaxID=6334 RepID=UPI0001EFD6F1|nr:conserved hypothetical protein [Trichinella spiralis]